MAQRTGRGERGQTTVEFIGVIPILILVGLALIQLGLVAYSAEQAGTGARAAARAVARDAGADADAVARAAMSDWVARQAHSGSTPGSDEVTVRTEVDVPSLFGIHLGTVTRTVTMPRDPSGN